MNLVTVSGAIKFVIYDDRENSKTKNSFFEIVLSLSNYQRLTVPSGLWMAFQGLGDSNLLMNMASIEHDPNEVRQAALSTFSYHW
jgi:dTDP-4-dehydrorhamnose 3,5-epimerase